MEKQKNLPKVDPDILRSSKDLFISIAAHKLLGPITIIKWNLELMLKDSKLSAKSKEKANDIALTVKKLEDFANVLLKVVQANLGESIDSHELVSINLNEVSKMILAELENEIIEQNLEVEISIPEGFEFDCKYDDYVIRELLRILIENAVYYNKPGGGVVIKAEKLDGSLLFTVDDTGIGIPDNEISMIGEAFYRTTNSQKLSVKGNGLDLYLCNLMVNNIGGKMWFESKEKEGSTFYLLVPARITV